MSKYTFGPVNSRRFGLSLGIDLSPSQKSCNFDCLYCELESAKPVSKIANPPKVQEIVSEVQDALEQNPNIEVITITSNGEPTLFKDLDKLVDALNKIKKDKKLLILSNSSTIHDIKIQNILKKIDIVKLSLDCATQKCFKKLDRPLSDIKIIDIISGMIDFRVLHDKILIVEILVVKNINDTHEQMKNLNKALQNIKPDRIDLGSIDRPPAYKIEPVSSDKLKKLSKEFQNLPVSIMYKKKPDKTIDFTKEQIISLLKRRPQSEEDVKYLFSKSAKDTLEVLVAHGKISEQDIAGVKFYTV